MLLVDVNESIIESIKKVHDKDGNVSLVLRTPDAPRFEPSASSSQVLGGAGFEEETESPEFSKEEVSVSQEEFEKEYEVN